MPRTKSKTAVQPPAEDARPEPITLVGRLVADPQLRHTNSGKAVSTIRIAVADGSETSFHSVVLWGRTAEVVCQYLVKGRLVEVTGHANERTYTASDDTERTVTEIVAWRVQFISRPKASSATTSKEVA